MWRRLTPTGPQVSRMTNGGVGNVEDYRRNAVASVLGGGKESTRYSLPGNEWTNSEGALPEGT